MQAIKVTEVTPQITELLEVMHSRQVFAEEWFGTLGGAAHVLATNTPGTGSAADDAFDALPPDMGPDFRLYYAVACVAGITAAIDAQAPGASDPLGLQQKFECFEFGYWMRALSVSLPDEAHVEFAAEPPS